MRFGNLCVQARTIALIFHYLHYKFNLSKIVYIMI